MCSKKAQVRPHGNAAFYFMDIPLDPCLHKNQITTHHISPELMLRTYSFLKNASIFHERCEVLNLNGRSENPALRYSKRGRLIVGKKKFKKDLCL